MLAFKNSLNLLFLSISFGDAFLLDIFKISKLKDVRKAYEEQHKIYNQAPPYVDWRNNGKVSPVKSQQNCAACWAFSVVGSIESHLRIYLQQNTTLSEQFLIDCVPSSNGCTTGSLIKTYAEIVSILGGVLSEGDYFPYSNQKKECRWNNNGIKVVPVIGFKRVFPNEDVMVEYVASHGPLSVAINSKSMESYKGGIDEPTDEKCSPAELNHSVLIVGYSTYVSKETGKSTPYWIIKNSWGTDWGDKGYYYLVRGRNACGIASDVSFPYVQ
ncbi:PREDICTED: cathepsin F-like [Papilio polytes]|uniref:cathepsin F-like n=1 Tax=Papilio polytes TaxID=76194 RepID=UPI0006761B49|nr:PREDICTED: cathepsin F-like [Papilio polytes]